MKKLIVLFTYSLLLVPFLGKAQIAINNSAANPDASAILDLNTGNAGVNKGFLPPQVALTNVTVAAPVASPATGLIVYTTTAPTGGNGTGYYYWNGSSWLGLGTSPVNANLTEGTGISAFTYNGTGAATVSIANTGVTANSYGNTTTYPTFTVNAQGQLTVAGTQPLPTSLPPSGTAGGDLSGTYPNPTVAKINGATVPAAGSLTTGNVLQVNGINSTTYGPVDIAGGVNYITGNLPVTNLNSGTNAGTTTFWRGDGTWANPTAATLSNLTQGTGITAFTYNGSSAATVGLANTGVTAGSYGSATTVPTYTVNAQGQITGAANVTITSSSGTVTSFSSGNLSPLFTTSVTTNTTTPALTYSLSNAGAYSILGNNTNASAVPTYFTPTLASALFKNQGTTTTVLHGNAAGNPAWAAVDLATDVSNNLAVANLNSGTNASSTTFWRGDGTWATPAGSSIGGSGTNNYLARWTPNGSTLGTGLIQDNGTTVGINGAPVTTQMLTVTGGNYGGIYATTGDASSTYAAIYGEDDNNYGVEGVGGNAGVYGSSSTGYGGSFVSSLNAGVYGTGSSGGYFTGTAGAGVLSSGTTYGGNFTATTGIGVSASAINGQGIYSTSTHAAGDSSIGITKGVYGLSTGYESTGIVGSTTGLQSIGVIGSTTGSNGTGVYGTAVGYDAIGVYGNVSGPVGYGIYGNGYYGVWGNSNYATGVVGIGTTLGGYFSATAGQGVNSTSSSAAGDSSIGTTYGVYGITSDPTGKYAGVYGEDDQFAAIGVKGVANDGYGVYGNGYYAGIYGEDNYGGGTGVWGQSTNGTGVYGNGSIGVIGGGGIGGQFYGTSYAIIVPPSDGNVGIGTSTPTTLMQMGNATTTSGQFSVFSQDYTNGQIQIGNPNSNAEASMGFISGVSSFGDFAGSSQGSGNVWNIGAGNWGIGAGKFSIANAGYGGSVMTFTSAGNVGIRCTSPIYTLDVNGDVRASGSVYYGGTACSGAGTAYSKPDYVFEPDYKKTYTPFEVEEFIIANGHLPWVTSATDETKENNGTVNITRMSFQTLEAAENIQKQVIEQQKTIVSQQAEIDQLKKQTTTDSQQAQIDLLKKQVADLSNSLNLLLNKQK